MKERRLISMVEYVLLKWKNRSGLSSDRFKDDSVDIFNYAKFLSQPLELGMFVPCDEDGNVLEEPKNGCGADPIFMDRVSEFETAKERVIFEGFELINAGVLGFVRFKFLSIPIKELQDYTADILIPYGVYLTENAYKKYFK